MFRSLLFVGAAGLSALGGKPSVSIQPPPHATLVAQSQVSDVRALPEAVSTAVGRTLAVSDRSYVQGVDKLYELPLTYDDSVHFFDEEFKNGGPRVLARTVTATSTAWTVRRADDTLAHTVVRNTTPTTVEVSEAAPSSWDAASLSATSRSQ